jgi:hypothetical protein
MELVMEGINLSSKRGERGVEQKLRQQYSLELPVQKLNE